MNDNDIRENRSPEEIESELAQTRAQVSSTIDAIQNKLTPGQLMDQALDYWRTSAPADFGANLSASVRQNPLPVALVGVGLAWLMMAGRKPDRGYRASRYENEDYGYDEDYVPTAYGGYAPSEGEDSALRRAGAAASDTAQHLKDKASELGDRASETVYGLRDSAAQAGERAGAAYERFKGRASEMGGRASDMAYGARDRMYAAASGAKARMSDLQDRSREQYYRARSGVSHMVDEQPLVIGAIGLAIGAALGASLPPTRREDEWMGDRRDDLMEGARETAREYVEPMKESARRVAETAEQEVRRATGNVGGTAGQGAEPASSDDVAGTQTYTGSSAAPGQPGSMP